MLTRIAPPSLLFLAILGALAALPLPGAAGEPSPRRLMAFGADAAQKGLWREATFRWERAVQGDPANARLRNNLAVAYESQGRLEDADREYREALRLDPESRSIRANHASFLELHPEFQKKEAADGAAPAADVPTP